MVYIPMAVVTAAAEEMYVTKAEDAPEDAGGEVDKVEENTAKDIM